jgi:hypothetical protein
MTARELVHVLREAPMEISPARRGRCRSRIGRRAFPATAARPQALDVVGPPVGNLGWHGIIPLQFFDDLPNGVGLSRV